MVSYRTVLVSHCTVYGIVPYGTGSQGEKTACAKRRLASFSLSLAEAVFGAQIVLPNEFLQNDERSVDTIVNKFSKTLQVSASSLPRHNSSTDLPSELPAELLSAPLIWVRRGSLVPPLQPLYDGPYAVLRRGPRSFTIRVGSRSEVVFVSRLKACTAATPGSQRRCGRLPGSHPGSLDATKWVSFSAGPFTFLFSGADTRRSQNRFPTRRGGFCMPGNRWRLHSLHRRGTRLVNGYRPRGSTSVLFSSQPSQSSRGALWRATTCV
jgi:hypothetical protein